MKMVRIEFPLSGLDDVGLYFAIFECLNSFKTKIKWPDDHAEYFNIEKIKEALGKLEENDNCFKFVSCGLPFKISII